MKTILAVLTIIGIFMVDMCTMVCYRKPQGASGDRSPVNEKYQIFIDGNPSTYIPGQQYNISLSCANGLTFISFTLLVEAESSAPLVPPITATSAAADGDHVLGRFELIDNAETKFSNLCESMIESSNTNTKNRIDVAWVAPSDAQSGCVLFKAAVLQHRNVWFIDDGFLTKRLCPEEIDEVNSQTPQVNPCCACDEAKYEIILERKWMRNTHARDFPSEAWRSRLGEVIGASHMVNFSFWEYGGRASQGLQELAEHGATSNLENEIKAYTGSGFIRTIIKAPGIVYRPNILGKTLANVRVGPEHHVISLVSKIDPSPDWILGVAGLELCLANCTWIEKKVLNLYPWDVGTDAGPTYMSPDQAQFPPDVIRRITSTFPSDYRSPFFDESGAPMKPLATLYVNRKRTYERVCNFEETGPMECSTHPWNEWTDCTAICGAGTQYQIRSYKDPQLAENFNCKVVLRRNRNCIGTQCGVQQSDIGTAECELGPWSKWSDCSKTCGKGDQTKTRDYINPEAKENCQTGLPMELEQTRPCNGNKCGGNILNPYYDSNSNNNMFNENFEQEESEQTVLDRPNYDRKNYNTDFTRKSYQTDDANKPSEQFNNMDFNNNDNQDHRSQISKPFEVNENQEEEEVNVNNIYGSQKFVGKSRKNYGGVGGGEEQENQNENPNIFGDLESSQMENNRWNTNRKSQPYGQNQNRYGFNENDPLTPTNQYGMDENQQGINGNSRYGINNQNQYENRPDRNNPMNRFDNRYKNPSDFSNSRNEFNNEFRPSGFKTIDGENVSDMVDNFCLKKPTASTSKCSKKHLVVKNYWFFDADDGECKLFTADNCDTNKNKFRSLEKCEAVCGHVRAYLPPNRPDDRSRGGFVTTQRPFYRSRWN